MDNNLRLVGIRLSLFFFLVLSFFSIAFFYSLAMPGYFLFDDWPNLSGLSLISDLWSGLSFVSSGIAGPLGRPIALATFAFQADAWDGHPELMLGVNIFIHLSAFIGAFFLAAGLARFYYPKNDVLPWWIGLAVAVIWGLSPFLATTHLMIIQRMTSLSGLFLLCGLAAFVWAHLVDKRHRLWRWLLLFFGLGFGTLLSALSKENGALLPWLALIILWLWIPKEYYLRDRVSRSILLFLMILPAILLFFYLASRIPGILDNSYGPRRYFTPEERLLTQPLILLDYLRYLLFPKPIAVSPFMDHWPQSTGWFDPPSTIFAALFWPVLIGISIWLRKKAPYLLFGVLFFLVAHILESSFIGLEMYFAHRNYIPAFGLYFALVFFLFSVPQKFRRIVFIGLIGYILVFAGVLWQVTSGWNEKHINGEVWLNHNPNSIRGAQFLANRYLDQNDFFGAHHVIKRAVERHPDEPLLNFQLTDNCIHREMDFPETLQNVLNVLSSTPRYNPQVAFELLRISQEKNHSPLCELRDFNVLYSLIDALLSNPIYERRSGTSSMLYLAKAFVSSEINRFDQAVDYFVASFRSRPNIDVAFYGMGLMANIGDYDRVYHFLEEVRTSAPDSRLGREIWMHRLDEFEQIIRESERIDRERLSQGVEVGS
ncbi:hypothetical protein SAMN05421693_10253 [Ectothiorhodospira magna]|uniref:Tetratricopeptide repeat-containing protein n=1 Tax=Ectothiorhodospira magna TaxID=867345 RepID=A0A1H8ZB78_9GAMM|nr:tetratricopeptide repeat protein [Ectothiorhodospira magna]SEP61601.1 hypothetical protein SAMN05421693_10253 [Ectothiorhodospira magna]